MFIQGGACFFCKSALPRAEASIEHLFASANGGGNNEENCVACCKVLNALLGSMSLKDKFQVVLNQRGNFKCPRVANASAAIEKSAPQPVVASAKPAMVKPDHFSLALANLKKRSDGRPRTLATLANSLTTLFPKSMPEGELAALIEKLQSSGKISIEDGKVSYAL